MNTGISEVEIRRLMSTAARVRRGLVEFAYALRTRPEPMVSGLLNHAEVPELANSLGLISGPF
jgi:hypothetical protein